MADAAGYKTQKATALQCLLQAAQLGRACSIPCSVDPGILAITKQLAGGSQSLLYAGTYQGSPCAVKKAIIRTTDDLENFRKDLLMSAEVQHEHVLGVKAARLLPPRAWLPLSCQCMVVSPLPYAFHARFLALSLAQTLNTKRRALDALCLQVSVCCNMQDPAGAAEAGYFPQALMLYALVMR